MSEAPGKPYEALTQVIFQAILGQKEFPNLVVEHDVILQGKTGRHQIDVYWKFEFGGVIYEVIVQAKDWRKPVDQSHILAFKAILEDLPGQTKGIFVTRTGYQKGAKEFALAHGILLYELKEAEDQPSLGITVGGWARYKVVRMPLSGLITAGEPDVNAGNFIALGFEVDVFTPFFSAINFSVPKGWLQAEYPTVDTDSFTKIMLAPIVPSERLFFDDKGAVVGNLAPICDEIIQAMKKENVDTKKATHTFEPPVFIQTDNPVFPRVKVVAVSVDAEIRHAHELRRCKMSNFTQLVLHQLNSDQKWWFAATPKLISSLSKPTSKKRPK